MPRPQMRKLRQRQRLPLLCETVPMLERLCLYSNKGKQKLQVWLLLLRNLRQQGWW